jgi:hypothetical protein
MAKKNGHGEIEMEFDAHDLKSCYARVLNDILDREVDFRNRYDARVSELYGEAPDVTLGSWVAWILEQGYHMAIPMHPAYEPGAIAYDSTAVCPICLESWHPPYRGALVCSNKCAETQQWQGYSEAAKLQQFQAAQQLNTKEG